VLLGGMEFAAVSAALALSAIMAGHGFARAFQREGAATPAASRESPSFTTTRDTLRSMQSAPLRFRPINRHAAAMRFVAWMRDNHYTDYLTVPELDQTYLDFCREVEVEPIDARELREFVRALPGVYHGRPRINGPRWARLRQRVHVERPVLYRVLSQVELETAGVRARPDTVGPEPGQDRPSADARKKQSRKRVLAPAADVQEPMGIAA